MGFTGVVISKFLVGLLDNLFKKSAPEKIRVTIRDGKLMKVIVPASVYENNHELAVRQSIECYRIKLNGHYLSSGLGGLGGIGITPYT